MKNYEIAVIVHPDLDETAFQEILDKIQEWVKDADGKITNVDLWGKRKLAYEIRKQTEGQYIILQAELEPSTCIDIERNLRLQESIMRFMISNQAPVIQTAVEEVPDAETSVADAPVTEAE